jgi:tripartite-type tricarboxylate transporter receptor subunit TctC
MKPHFSLALLAVLFCASHAFAQQYPTRPIRLIVPFGPGGGSDISGRLVAQKLTEQMGQQVVVDNRPGAASLIGTEIVAKSAPDGYTLCLCDVGFTINPAYYKNAQYDPVKDFDPVMVVAETPYVLVVNPGLPYVGSVKDFIAAVKSQPGKLSLGSAGAGSGSHFAGELLKQSAGLNMVHVPYKSAAASATDVASSQIPAAMGTAPAAMSLLKAGRVKILASAGPKRSSLLPDVPTFTELGMAGATMTNWYSIMSVGGTPKPVLQRLHTELSRAVAAPDMRERLAAIALEPAAPNTPEEFRKLIAEELQRWRKVMKQAGIGQE